MLFFHFKEVCQNRISADKSIDWQKPKVIFKEERPKSNFCKTMLPSQRFHEKSGFLTSVHREPPQVYDVFDAIFSVLYKDTRARYMKSLYTWTKGSTEVSAFPDRLKKDVKLDMKDALLRTELEIHLNKYHSTQGYS